MRAIATRLPLGSEEARVCPPLEAPRAPRATALGLRAPPLALSFLFFLLAMIVLKWLILHAELKTITAFYEPMLLCFSGGDGGENRVLTTEVRTDMREVFFVALGSCAVLVAYPILRLFVVLLHVRYGGRLFGLMQSDAHPSSCCRSS